MSMLFSNLSIYFSVVVHLLLETNNFRDSVMIKNSHLRYSVMTKNQIILDITLWQKIKSS